MEFETRNECHQRWGQWVGAVALAFAATFAFHSVASAQFTYTRDVAPIIQKNCTVCHQPGGIGPIELVDYEDVQRYSRLISNRVANRIMPPYYYDNDIGIQDLKHDWRLSDEDINTVVTWAAEGAPMGDPADMPDLPPVPDANEWSLAATFGPPDLIVPSTPIDVPADGLDMWHRPFVPVGNVGERCIKAIQLKPYGEAKAVVHHANSTFQLLQPDGSFRQTGRASEYAMGKLGEILPEGVCRKIPADAWVAWDIHMFPGGIGAAAPNTMLKDNVIELGIWLYPEDYEYEYRQNLTLYGLREGSLLMPPGGSTMTQGFHSFDHPVRIDSFQPHGHLRMRSASLEIYYPETGRTQVISMVSNWSATWHQSHLYGDDSAPLVPAGAVLVIKQWYDNSADNPNNPDFEQWVSGGNRTADEMSHAWIAITHLDQEGYDRLVEERRAKAELAGGGG